MAKSLSKSNYIRGLRCSKLLWLYCHEPNSIPKPTGSAKYFIDQGNEVGELAHKLFPNGRYIDTADYFKNLNDTKTFMALRIPLFEPSFYAERLYARADILEPLNDGSWNIYEVKGSTSVKDEQVRDVAYQRYVFRKAGLKINKVFVVIVNSDYLYDGNLDLKQFFKIEDVSERADKASDNLDTEIADMLKVIDSSECPNTSLHPSCKGNRYCEMLSICSADLPQHSVTTLIADNEGNGMKLLMQGIIDIQDIPLDYTLNAKQEIQRKCILENKTYVNKDKIKEFLDILEYPLYFLDFETIQKAVPFFANSKPYQQIPFQYSLHVIEKKGATPKHYEYLHNNDQDPRPNLLNHLKQTIGTNGSILVYYDDFEKGRLKEASENFPQHADWIAGVLDRIVDLFSPFKSLHYYNPEQCGSVSLKKVLPALTGTSYDDLEIQHGDMAPAEYLRCYFSNEITNEDCEHTRNELLKYCGRDTEGMIFIIQALEKIVK